VGWFVVLWPWFGDDLVKVELVGQLELLGREYISMY